IDSGSIRSYRRSTASQIAVPSATPPAVIKTSVITSRTPAAFHQDRPAAGGLRGTPIVAVPGLLPVFPIFLQPRPDGRRALRTFPRRPPLTTRPIYPSQCGRAAVRLPRHAEPYRSVSSDYDLFTAP